MAAIFNLGTGPQASYTVSEDGNVNVSVKSGSPLKPKAVYVGTGILGSNWVSTGKSSSWQFAPRLFDPTPVQFSESTDDYQNQIVNVELGKRLFPATGLIQTNLIGEIRAPAIHFDLPHAYDLWVAIVRSPWFPLKLSLGKLSLNIVHDSAQATAQLQNIGSSPEDMQSLHADVSVHGDGFKKVQLSIKRSVQKTSSEEIIGELTSGFESFTWKPTVRTFNTVLVTYSDMYMNHFLAFLQQLGAETRSSFLAMGSYLQSNFLLCDGLGIDYSVRLIGEKHILGHEKDQTNMTYVP